MNLINAFETSANSLDAPRYKQCERQASRPYIPLVLQGRALLRG
ncbi:hypothetical protein [Shewanella baltica]